MGIFLIFLPSFVGSRFDIQENKKYIYLYIIFSTLIIPIIKNKIRKIDSKSKN